MATTEPVKTDRFEPATVAAELVAGRENHAVGTRLLFENDRVKIWEISLEPGQRVPFHCHDQDYFFTCVQGGRGFQRTEAGEALTFDYQAGETRYFAFGPGERMVHDLENAGVTPLKFVTVELKR